MAHSLAGVITRRWNPRRGRFQSPGCVESMTAGDSRCFIRVFRFPGRARAGRRCWSVTSVARSAIDLRQEVHGPIEPARAHFAQAAFLIGCHNLSLCATSGPPAVASYTARFRNHGPAPEFHACGGRVASDAGCGEPTDPSAGRSARSAAVRSFASAGGAHAGGRAIGRRSVAEFHADRTFGRPGSR